MKKKNPILIIGFGLLGLLVAVALFFLFRYSNQPKVRRIQPTTIAEGKDAIVNIRGRNFPDSSKIKVTFSGIPGVIQTSSKRQLSVWADIEKINGGKPQQPFFISNMAVIFDNKVIKMQAIRCEFPIVVNDFTPKQFPLGSWITFTGQNLQNTHRLKVKFTSATDSKQHNFITSTKNSFSVQVPPLQGEIPTTVTIEVFGDNKSVFKSTGKVKKKLILNPGNIIDFNQ